MRVTEVQGMKFKFSHAKSDLNNRTGKGRKWIYYRSTVCKEGLDIIQPAQNKDRNYCSPTAPSQSAELEISSTKSFPNALEFNTNKDLVVVTTTIEPVISLAEHAIGIVPVNRS